MILTAADSHRVLLRGAQSGKGLAGIEQPARRALQELDIAAGGGSGAGQKLQKIECRAFAGQQRARRPGDAAQRLIGGRGGAFAHPPFDAHGGIKPRKRALNVGNAAEHGIFPRDDGGLGACARWDQRGGQIAAANVLFERPLDLLRKILWNRYWRRHQNSPRETPAFRPGRDSAACNARPSVGSLAVEIELSFVRLYGCTVLVRPAAACSECESRISMPRGSRGWKGRRGGVVRCSCPCRRCRKLRKNTRVDAGSTARCDSPGARAVTDCAHSSCVPEISAKIAADAGI